MLRDEDMIQQEALARLSRRREDSVEAFGKRERGWIYNSAISIVTYEQAKDGEGVQL